MKPCGICAGAWRGSARPAQPSETPMSLTDKRVSLPEAVAVIQPGMTIAFGGVTLYRRPFAFAFQMVQQLKPDRDWALNLLCFTAGIESDILVGAGLVDSVRTCYFGFEIFGLAPHFTVSASQGTLRVIEESEASLAYGIRASMAGVGFMPSTAWQGTELFDLRPDVRSVVDPYSGETLTAFPAIACDLAVIHALVADKSGNAHIGDNQGLDPELVLVAEHVVVTAERVVDSLDRAEIVAPVVRAVVEVPDGAWPTSCHPYYPIDGLAILSYLEAAGTPQYPELLESWEAHMASR